jgi:hypothetical protein
MQGVSAESEAEAGSAMIAVVEAKRHHCGLMARRMRQSQGDAIGIDVHREMVKVFERSSFRRSVFWKEELVEAPRSRLRIL